MLEMLPPSHSQGSVHLKKKYDIYMSVQQTSLVQMAFLFGK